MTTFAIAAACGLGFLATHHAMSHPPIRERLVAASGGENGFWALYSLVSLVFYTPLAGLWWTNTQTTPIWWANHGVVATTVASALNIAGMVFVVGGATGSGRTSLMTKMAGKSITRVVGMNGFTRHPLFAGIALFSVGHLLVDGGAVDVAFHGTNLAVSLIGMVHQDHRYRLAQPDYVEWEAKTRLIPLPWPVAGTELGGRFAAQVVVGIGLAVAARYFLH